MNMTELSKFVLTHKPLCAIAAFSAIVLVVAAGWLYLKWVRPNVRRLKLGKFEIEHFDSRSTVAVTPEAAPAVSLDAHNVSVTIDNSQFGSAVGDISGVIVKGYPDRVKKQNGASGSQRE